MFVTSELCGYLKAGGLGEVSAALPRALNGLCDIRVLMPAYPAVRRLHDDVEIIKHMPAVAGLPPWSLGRAETPDGLTMYFVICDALYDRDGSPYGAQGADFGDNDVRFARLSLAAAEIAEGVADPNWRPHVVHANDWPTALTPAYIKWKGLDVASILTIHNLAFQGLFNRDRLGALAIPEQAMNIDGVEFHGRVSFLKAGIAYSSQVTTVSETYAREITSWEHGCGLDGLLRTRSERGELTGILNGIDPSWEAFAEEAEGPEFVRDFKTQKARELRRLFRLDDAEGPLFSIVSRLVHQKGIDLSIQAAELIVANGGQLVVTGQGDPELERAVETLAEQHPGAVAARIGFDDAEARTMYEGSDFLLMPSRFEPCGLSQMYAQSQASLPIACRTGGLADTIDDGGTGFLFTTASEFALKRAVGRAFRTYWSGKRFHEMRQNALSKRFDWLGPAVRYRSLYQAA
ncbi:MAG: glycogen synthase GlgA [Pseudomonadota bacterium]|nr:glycogen synthase GlgA [Pseudomonadota bacterium]